MFEKVFYTSKIVVHDISMNSQVKNYDKGNRNY